MKSTGMVRPVDRMGRIVIPKEIRKQLEIKSDVDSLEIYTEGDYIILHKFEVSCFFCGSMRESVEMNGHTICMECIEKLRQKALEPQGDAALF